MAIVGTDNRSTETNTVREPNRWICLFNVNREATRLVWTFRKGNVSVREERPSEKLLPWDLGGTGCLISPRHVLTAAHVLSQLSSNRKDWKDGRPTLRLDGQVATVAPGHNGSFPAAAPKKLKTPYGVFRSSNLLLPKKYSIVVQDTVAFVNRENDFALVDLGTKVDDLAPRYTRRFRLGGRTREENVQLPRLGFWGDSKDFEIRATTAQELDGRDVFTVGYPTRKPDVKTRPRNQWMQWLAKGRVNKALRHAAERNDHEFYYTAVTTDGQSGSPVWVEERSGNRTIKVMVGLAVAARQKHVSIATGSYSVGIVLTDDVLSTIEQLAPQTFRFKAGRLSARV